jgi:GNAT superfamily N-acetyltransferase
MIDQGVRVREAVVSDANALGDICRRSFLKSPEWQAPTVIVRRWWQIVIEHPDCIVCSVVESDRVVGFYIAVRDEGVWGKLSRQGPNSKWMKGLILLTHPSFLRSFINKRLRARRRGSVVSDVGGESAKKPMKQVCAADILGNQEGMYLAIMAVDPQVRNRGTGKLMIEHFAELGVELSLGVIWLHVDPRNERAQGLYSRCGYELGGRDGSSYLMYKSIVGG